MAGKIIFIGLWLVAASISAQKDITSVFKLKWKTKIGVTTYRTNICEQDGSIYIGSNGEDANSFNDKLDGVIKLDAKTGKVLHIFQSQLLGDNDVTGIGLTEDKLYFGTDNYYFYCFDLETKQELWKFPTEYDVESVPVLSDCNGDGLKDVIFAVENYGFYALNGSNGEVIWHHDSIQSHSGNVAPLLVDCNGDGVKDVVTGANGLPYTHKTAGFKMAHYGDYHIAFNGKNGETLWALPSGAGIHASPFLFEDENKRKLICGMDAYGEFQIFNLKGEQELTIGFGYNKYMSPVMFQDKLIVGDFSLDISQMFRSISNDSSYHYLNKDTPENESVIKGTVSATTMVGDVLGKGSQQFLSVSESGNMIIRSETGKVLHNLQFPKGAEASVFIKDVDNDGKLELLVASLDGYLYCYETNSSGNAQYGQFRWNNNNLPID